MYTRRRRSPLSNLLVLILLGAFGGIAFVIYDSVRTQDVPSSADLSALPTQTPAVTPAPTSAPPTRVRAGAGGGAIPPTITPNTLASPTQPMSSPIGDQRPYLSIPELGVYSPIIEVFLDGVSWDVSRLGVDVGHLQGTAWLDEPGNIVLSGHVELSDGRNGAFRDLEQISIGRRVSIVYKGQTRHYEVVEQYKVEPTDLTPLYPSDRDRLTLITCGEYDFFSNTYLKRVVVVADRVG